ncbi:uncharacterized protein LOC124807787 [Hydra vulgaris]|uniref:uncharacterized protein LOC124807787 n=1 Tax=Hydra vulgaris TaxID=6087 RepID=UPI001F5E38CF|nr:uncharacterized protein LOC124807787 isoform X2 [Hydra vulgaris]XP_047126123.1 uncharacterized protein LOC124807787 isoform X2 [Hydra vulgaris]XP_047126124.1 uncharacterized protein LOC124807787 isoform X2 [Hydra vulgaris]
MDQDLMHLLSNDQKDYIFLALREFSDNLKHSDFTFKVLVPEAILYFFAELEGISRNKAEVLLSSYSSQRTNELVNKLPDEDDAFSADKNLVAGSKELLNGSADFSENENSSNKESSQIAQPVLEKEEKQPQYFYNFITYLTENIYPPGLGKNDKRTFRSVAKKYCVQDGKLKRKVTVCGNSVYADVIMDTEERLKIFTLEHDSPLGGHSGQTKTKAKIMEKYYCPNISGDIIKWEEVIVEVEKNRNHVENLTNLISKNIKDAQVKQKKYYDARVQKNCKVSADPIMVGDKVLLLDIRGRRSKGAAFKPRFKGPYYVAHITKCGNFKLNDLNNIPLKSTYHKLHIKKFIESLEKVWLVFIMTLMQL